MLINRITQKESKTELNEEPQNRESRYCIRQADETEIHDQFPTPLQGGLTTSILFVANQGSPRVRWIQFSNLLTLSIEKKYLQYSQSHFPSSLIEVAVQSSSGKVQDRNKREQ